MWAVVRCCLGVLCRCNACVVNGTLRPGEIVIALRKSERSPLYRAANHFVRCGRSPYRRRRSDHEPNHGLVPVVLIALVIALLDWTAKAIVNATIPLGEFVEVWEGTLALWHVRNPAMILGLWGNLPLESRKVIATGAGLLAVLLMIEIVDHGHRLPPPQRICVWLFAGLAFGGMLGNLGERLIHWGVTDYLSFRWGEFWLPPGNVADLALFLSALLSLPVIIFELAARAKRRTSAAPSPSAGLLPEVSGPA
jgi:lipoprotein signal peptidase